MTLHAPQNVMRIKVSKTAHETFELCRSERLLTEENHQVLEESVSNLADDRVFEIVAQIHTEDFGANRTGQRTDLDRVITFAWTHRIDARLHRPVAGRGGSMHHPRDRVVIVMHPVMHDATVVPHNHVTLRPAVPVDALRAGCLLV